MRFKNVVQVKDEKKHKALQHYIFFNTSIIIVLRKPNFSNMINSQELNNKINQSGSLSVGDIMNASFELFKKVWTYGFLIQLLILAITIPVSLLLYSPLIQELVSQFSSGNFNPERIDALSIPSSFSGLLSFYGISLLLGAVKYLFYCGFYKIVRDIDENKEANFKDVFLYFKPNYFGKGMLLMIIASLISFFAAAMCLIPLIYAFVPVSFFIVFFAFNPDLAISEHINLSFYLGTKKWGVSFVASLLMFIILLFGTLISCGLGSLFLGALVLLPFYVVYKQVILK